MSSLEFDGSATEREISAVIKELIKHCLFVAVESNGKIDRYIPKDMRVRNKLVELSVQKRLGRYKGYDPAYYLLMYARYPYKIREFNEEIKK